MKDDEDLRAHPCAIISFSIDDSSEDLSENEVARDNHDPEIAQKRKPHTIEWC